jgi:hypothetical protein
MHTYDTVSQAISGLKNRGYTIDFNIAFDKLICSENRICFEPSEFEITEVYRFEGNTDPGDEAAVYAVESLSGTVKGVLTTAFGTYADAIDPELLKKLSIHLK